MKEDFNQVLNGALCNILFIAGDNKVRDHGHVIGKYRGSAHRSCNINLK